MTVRPLLMPFPPHPVALTLKLPYFRGDCRDVLASFPDLPIVRADLDPPPLIPPTYSDRVLNSAGRFLETR